MNAADAAAPPPPAQESAGLRYYTSQLLLRVLATDAYDPQGASFAPFGSTEHAPFLSVAEPHLVPPLLLRAPALVVVPPEGSAAAQTHHETRGVFTVLPAEGFVKEPGQPVYYNDPIQLMDQRGRLLGVVARAPFAGHLAADGHGGALVFVFERHTSRLQAIGDKFLRNEARRSMSVSAAAPPPASSSASGSDVSSGVGVSSVAPISSGAVPHRRASLVQVCGGERLRIPGLTRVVKKNYPGGCIVQPKLEDTSRSRSNGRNSLVDDEPPYLTCEVVLTTPAPPSLKRSESGSSTASSTTSSASKKGTSAQIADRTATGEFVGVLHSGVLHRRSDHLKLWKKRFFVLTQVALHRFDAHETLQSVRTTQSARGSIYLKDCRGVRYERFSRPHELEIELNNGKVFSLHSVDALTCSDWASVLSRAIENPHWVHAERSYLTVWRSDAQFESPQCPAITKVVLRHGRGKILGCVEPKMKTISTAPHWSEKLSLGHVKANGFLLVQLADGSVFRLTLEDLTRSLIQPRWIAVSTSLEVARISALEGDEDDVPSSLSNDLAQRKSDVITDEKSRFLVRLKFQADLQMDRRLTRRLSHEFERRVVLGTFSSLVMLPAIGYSYVHSIDAWARSLCVVSSALLVVGIVAVAPVAWYMYLWMRYGHSMEGELHWFLTLLALEVRPHHDDISDRMSISSGEDSRSRVDSFVNDDENEIDDGAIVVPTKTPLYGLEKLQQNARLPAVLSPQAIRTFRLENALDSILGRPVLSFFAIKQFFPNRFLQRDEQGRRVLLISLNNTNRKGLISHNVSGFNVLRYFLYLWEFIWSYQDMQEGVSQSQLVLVVDCLGWQYYKWFSIECQIMVQLLNQTHRYYPGRLARVIFVRDQASFGVYGKLLGKGLDPALRDIVEKAGSLEPFAHKLSDITRSSDETALHDFVCNILATHANIAIPTFTRRELEQAARFTTTGSLKADEDQAALDSIGTRAVVLPSQPETFEWITIMDDKGFTMWRAKDASIPTPVAGKTYQSDSRPSQWRGRFAMNTRNADRVMQLLKDPKLAGAWMEDTEKIVQLEMLSRQEDVCFWSRRVPFMNFSRSGHRGDSIEANHVQTNAYFHCVMRRIQDVRKGQRPHDRVSTMMWKTTSAQQVVVDRPETSYESQEQGQIQWRKLEDPFVSLCFVVEEQAGTGLEQKTITLNFWFQSFSPPTTPKQDTEIAKLIARKFRALDAAASLASTKEIKR